MERPDTANYFRFYGLPEQFELDPAVLKRLYLDKSKQYHPDFYGQDPESQNLAMAATAYNNQAYKTLSNQVLRAMYLTDLKFRPEDANPALPQEFLMDMMELNEEIDTVSDESRENLLRQLEQYKTAIMTEITQNCLHESWQNARIAVLKWKYLERLTGRLV